VSKTSSQRQRPRSTTEVRALILDEAHRQFTENGYAATMKQIADGAGVTEKMVFRHFGSKASLYEATVVRQFSEFINTFVDTYETVGPRGSDDESGNEASLWAVTWFIDGALEFARENREILTTLMAARAHKGEGLEEVGKATASAFADLLLRMSPIAETNARRGLDVEVASAASAGMVLSIVLYSDWLFSTSSTRTEAEIRNGLIDLVMFGIARHRCEACEAAAKAESGDEAGTAGRRRAAPRKPATAGQRRAASR
jgi:AcrR family transcriptional regulator